MPLDWSFRAGLNVLYGASNTGKSFVVQAMSFMLGSSRHLPENDELSPYDAAWLGLQMRDGSEVTLFRSTKGGNFILYPGHDIKPAEGGIVLAHEHDPKSDANVSMHLLGLLGLAGKVLIKNASGEKDSLSFHHLKPYLFISEECIISGRSPFFGSEQNSPVTLERNVFKLLLTGHDDQMAVPSLSPEMQTAVRVGKLELIDEWIAGIDRELGDAIPIREALHEQSERLDNSLAILRRDLDSALERLDALVHGRRKAKEERALVAGRIAELNLTLDRFARLDKVFVSDIERLQAVEEGGALLMAMAGYDCPVCGAPPEEQAHSHHTDEIGRSYSAAAAEIRKIRRDRVELTIVVESLVAETISLAAAIEGLDGVIQDLDASLDEARPAERRFRERYEALGGERARNSHLINLHVRREGLVSERSRLDVAAPRRSDNGSVLFSVVGPVGDAYASVVQEILQEWRFPGAPIVSFDQDLQDIRLDGKERSAKGKGVRAILHAAMKVAVLVFCDRHRLPHPGIVVLDTPLLTCRAPSDTRHGPLEPDEVALKESGIASHFYTHLAGLAGIGQFIVVENSAPPPEASKLGYMIAFSGNPEAEDFGLIPWRRSRKRPSRQ